MSLFPESGLESVPETINFRIWLCRKASLASAILFLAYSVWSYQDYNVLNNAILKDIQAQNLELRTALHLMQGYAKGGETTVDTADSSRPTTPAAAAVMAAASVAVNSSLLSDDDSDADSDTTTLSYRYTPARERVIKRKESLILLSVFVYNGFSFLLFKIKPRQKMYVIF